MKKITIKTVRKYQMDSLFSKGGTLLHDEVAAAIKLITLYPEAELTQSVSDLVQGSLEQELVSLLGHDKYVNISKACRGKYRGFYDYGILIPETGEKHFFSTGRKGYILGLRREISALKRLLVLEAWATSKNTRYIKVNSAKTLIIKGLPLLTILKTSENTCVVVRQEHYVYSSELCRSNGIFESDVLFTTNDEEMFSATMVYDETLDSDFVKWNKRNRKNLKILTSGIKEGIAKSQPNNDKAGDIIQLTF